MEPKPFLHMMSKTDKRLHRMVKINKRHKFLLVRIANGALLLISQQEKALFSTIVSLPTFPYITGYELSRSISYFYNLLLG